MVVGLLGDGVDEFFAVWDNTSIIGKAVLSGVVSHGVVWCCILGSDHGHQHQQHQGCHHVDGDERGSEQEMEEETESVSLIPFILFV